MRCLAAAGYTPASETAASRGKSKESGGEASALETISKKSTRKPGEGRWMGDTQFLQSIDEASGEDEDGEMQDVELGEAPDEAHSRHWRPDGCGYLQSTVVQGQSGDRGAEKLSAAESGKSNSITLKREFEMGDSYFDQPVVR